MKPRSLHDFCTILCYDETGNSNEITVCLCQVWHVATSYCTALIIHHLGRDAKWRGMFVHEGPPRYGAYLLRYWEVRSDRPGQPSSWQFSLEAAGTGERHGFHDLEELLTFLREELARGLVGTDGGGKR
jgi:hypothetical protein